MKKGLDLVKKLLYFILPALSILMLLLGWILLALKNDSIPSPLEVITRFQLLLEKPISKVGIMGHIWASLKRVLQAWAYSILFGIPFGLMIGWSKVFRGIFKPLFEMIRPIPPIAWIPLVSIWFGVGETSKVILVFLGTVVPIIVNTYTGVQMVPELLIQAARSFGANNRQLFADVILPHSLQAIAAGFKTSLSVGWMVVLAAEMISAKSGLGFLIIRGSDSNDIALTMVAMIFIGVIGAGLSYSFNFVERKMCPWVEK